MKAPETDPMTKVLKRIFIIFILLLVIALYGWIAEKDIDNLFAAVMLFYFPLLYQWRKIKFEQIDARAADDSKLIINLLTLTSGFGLLIFQFYTFSGTLR